MGFYIDKVGSNWLRPQDKAHQLLELVKGAEVIHERPITFQPDLVCVVENGMFDAAGFCYSEQEMKDFERPDGRARTWLRVPGAAKLANYKGPVVVINAST